MLARGNLHFSQSSQPSLSQHLSNALEKCQLASQEPMAAVEELQLSQQDAPYASQQLPLESCTQDGFLWYYAVEVFKIAMPELSQDLVKNLMLLQHSRLCNPTRSAV